MRGSRLGWLVAVGLCSMWLGCGSDADLFFGSGVDGSTATTSSGSGAATGTSASTSSSGTSSTTSSGNGGSGPGAGGPGGSTSSTSSISSSSASSSSSSGDPLSLPCDGQQCNFGGDSACCWDQYQQHGQPQAQCVNGPVSNDSCATLQIDNAGLETRIECAGPAYCPGQLCCARRKFFQANYQTMSVYDQLTCESQCKYPDIVVCDAQTQCPDLPGENGGPPIKSVCQQSQLLPTGYLVCGYP